jgi:hypothetical protein
MARTPHYTDLLHAIEQTALEQSREQGLGLAPAAQRYFRARLQQVEFGFELRGRHDWLAKLAIEKIGPDAASTAFRVRMEFPGQPAREERFFLRNAEQLSDAALQVAESLCAAAAGAGASAPNIPAVSEAVPAGATA